MGNTHSSMGLIVGSVLGGLIAAPFTGGASIAYVAAATSVGTTVGATSFVVNAVNNNDAPKGDEMSSFLTGAVCGAIGPAGGLAAGMGAEVAIGVEAAGIGIGLGATNAGDGKPKPYVGNQQKAVKHYTEKNEKQKFKKEVEKEVKKEEANQLNDYAKQYSNAYINYLDDTCYFHKEKTIKKIYKFAPQKKNDAKAFDKVEFHLYNDDPQVEKIYVIRRKLDKLPFYFGWMAHSGLLLKAKNGRWFICEYGVENDQNAVSLYEISIADENCDEFFHKNKKWNKQICGSEIKASIQSVRDTMKNKVSKHSYMMLFWNCHMAQEATREEFGLKVNKKYMDEKFQEEYNFSSRQF